MPSPSSSRAEQIAALYAIENDHLANIVARRMNNVDAQTIEDACSFAWMQMLRYQSVDLDSEPRYRIIAWLSTTAVARRGA